MPFLHININDTPFIFRTKYKMGSRLLQIQVTPDQEAEIRKLFEEKGWPWIEKQATQKRKYDQKPIINQAA